ncbi:MAG: DUF5074 domain-containing protein [Bacteroidaceae bacterium]
MLSSCRDDAYVYLSQSKQVSPKRINNKIKGFYLLNEGNMGMNRATIDFFDYDTGEYFTDTYSEKNPGVVKELGDVGNDIEIYGSKCYAVINSSNYIEVFDAQSGIHEGSISIPNCRYIKFHDGKAYVSSYSGPIAIDPNAEHGFVAEIDTTSLELTRKVIVGYQPEEMVIKENKLYVANSGGYRVPDYDRTVSVVDLPSFKVIKTIDVAINLHRMAIDKRGDIYVSSRGNYYDVSPNLYVIDSESDEVKQTLNIPVSEFCMMGDSLYYYSTAYSYNTGINEVTYGIIDTQNKQVISTKIINDGTDKNIMMPYGLSINPETKEIYITDAQNYVVTGYIYCYSPEGILKWKTEAGNIPAHIAYLYK